MTAAFRNALTGQVQHFLEGSVLHRLAGANPDQYEPIESEEPQDEPRKPRRRRSTTAKGSDD